MAKLTNTKPGMMTEHVENANGLASRATPALVESTPPKNPRLSLGHWVSIMALLIGVLGALALWLFAKFSTKP